jgi:MFS family permease
LAIALQAFLALISSVLVRRFGIRPLSFVGITFMGFGALLSSFCTETVGLLFLTAGCMIGVAESLLFSAASQVPSETCRDLPS